MNYFDQHVVTWQCGSTVIEMLQVFASTTSTYLPVQEHVAFLFDLMELAVNVYGLIDVCIQVCTLFSNKYLVNLQYIQYGFLFSRY